MKLLGLIIAYNAARRLIDSLPIGRRRLVAQIEFFQLRDALLAHFGLDDPDLADL